MRNCIVHTNLQKLQAKINIKLLHTEDILNFIKTFCKSQAGSYNSLVPLYISG